MEFYFDFERLNVYQKSLDFIDKICDIYEKFPQDYKISIGSNLVRAALSIANNIAEGNGKFSQKEKNRYFGISLDSARECISVFDGLRRRNLIDEEHYLELRKDGKEITIMIFGLIHPKRH